MSEPLRIERDEAVHVLERELSEKETIIASLSETMRELLRANLRHERRLEDVDNVAKLRQSEHQQEIKLYRTRLNRQIYFSAFVVIAFVGHLLWSHWWNG